MNIKLFFQNWLGLCLIKCMNYLKRMSFLNVNSALTGVCLFFATLQVSANAGQCINLFSQNETSSVEIVADRLDFPILKIPSWTSIDNYTRYDYTPYTNILFLNDGGKGGRALTATKSESQLVVSSDFNITKGVNIQLDNNYLPFRKNAFDLIVMNRGLCPCRGTIACGGIDTKREPMKQFLLSAIDIMDKTNPKSLAIFTGFYFPGLFSKTVPELWISIAKEIHVMYPNLQISLLSSDIDGQISYGFVGLAISTNPNVPIKQNLQQLIPGI